MADREATAEVELTEAQMVALVQAIDVSTPQWKIRNENLRLKDALRDALSSLRASRQERPPEPVEREFTDPTDRADPTVRERPPGDREGQNYSRWFTEWPSTHRLAGQTVEVTPVSEQPGLGDLQLTAEHWDAVAHAVAHVVNRNYERDWTTARAARLSLLSEALPVLRALAGSVGEPDGEAR